MENECTNPLVVFRVLLWVMLLSFVIRCHFLSIWTIRVIVIREADIRFVKKDHSLMIAKLPPFKNGEHNSENVCPLNRDITPLGLFSRLIKGLWHGRLSTHFHLNWVLGPFVHGRLQNLQTSEVTFAHVITPLNWIAGKQALLWAHCFYLQTNNWAHSIGSFRVAIPLAQK